MVFVNDIGQKGIYFFIGKSAKIGSRTILPEFQTFLTDKKSVSESKVSFYAFWVSKFLAFLNKNIADWQLKQAREALALYPDHFKVGKARTGIRRRTFMYVEESRSAD
jgi:hypothetical protein